MIVAETLLIGAAMVGALFYLGYGAARLMLSRALAPYRLVLMPFAGMALVIVWDYLALFFNFNLTVATWALVVCAAGLNLFAWRRGRANADAPGLREQLRASRWVWLLALVAFGAAVAPLWRYGYATVIGENWDYEFYLPLADYLRQFSTAQLASAPPNPLLTTILSRHILPLPMGFSYLHATLNTLLNVEALETFAILLGVLRGLGVAAAFVFFRAALRMTERASLAGAAFVALNGLLLWFTYWNFGLHLASLALLPVALVFGVNAMQEPSDWRGIVGAGFFLGALNVTYHPALVAAGLPLGALGIWFLVTRRDRPRILLAGVGILALTLAFSFPALWHIEDFRREYYGRAPLAIGLREFVPPSDAYGLSLNILELAVGHTIPTPWLYEIAARVWALAAPALTAGAVALSVYALWQLRRDAERRAVWYSIVAASVLYVLIFRLPFLRPYPYGFLKSLSLVSYVLIALAVQGAEKFSIFDLSFSISLKRAPKIVVGLIAVLTTGLVLMTFALSLEQYFKPAPPFFNADALRLRELSRVLPPGAFVFLTDRAEAQKIPMGLAAYVLREHETRGNVTTGYGSLDNLAGGAVYDYALLARGEDPTTRGYDAKRLWENETYALYAREPGVDYQFALNAETVASNPLRLTFGETQILSGTKTLNEAAGMREVGVILASMIPQRVTIAAGDSTFDVELTPGLSAVRLPVVTTPAHVTLTPHVAQAILDSARVTTPHNFPGAEVRLWLPYTQLRALSNADMIQVIPSPDTLLVTCTSRTASIAARLDARCFVANPGQAELTWRWIVRGTLRGTREERVIAQREARGGPQAHIEIAATTWGGLSSMQFDDAGAVNFEPQVIPDGSWRGDLEILAGDVLLARVELYRFEVQKNGQQLTRSSPRDGVLTVVQP